MPPRVRFRQHAAQNVAKQGGRRLSRADVGIFERHLTEMLRCVNYQPLCHRRKLSFCVWLSGCLAVWLLAGLNTGRHAGILKSSPHDTSGLAVYPVRVLLIMGARVNCCTVRTSPSGFLLVLR